MDGDEEGRGCAVRLSVGYRGQSRWRGRMMRWSDAVVSTRESSEDDGAWFGEEVVVVQYFEIQRR